MSNCKGYRLDSLQTQRVAAGLTVSGLAWKANVGDWTIRQLEAGGSCDVYEGQRIADALGVSLATLGKKDH